MRRIWGTNVSVHLLGWCSDKSAGIVNTDLEHTTALIQSIPVKVRSNSLQYSFGYNIYKSALFIHLIHIRDPNQVLKNLKHIKCTCFLKLFSDSLSQFSHFDLINIYVFTCIKYWRPKAHVNRVGSNSIIMINLKHRQCNSIYYTDSDIHMMAHKMRFKSLYWSCDNLCEL